ncbi:MAG: hypothetical protein NVV74_16885 [Magnetospirillum sp.]|nr:hypothetical protein [Magnetospirillum sp.]
MADGAKSNASRNSFSFSLGVVQLGDVGVYGRQAALSQVDIASLQHRAVVHAELAQTGDAAAIPAKLLDGLGAILAGRRQHGAAVHQRGDDLAGGGRLPFGQLGQVAVQETVAGHQTVGLVPQGVAVDDLLLLDGAPPGEGILRQLGQRVDDALQLPAALDPAAGAGVLPMGGEGGAGGEDQAAEQRRLQPRGLPPRHFRPAVRQAGGQQAVHFQGAQAQGNGQGGAGHQPRQHVERPRGGSGRLPAIKRFVRPSAVGAPVHGRLPQAFICRV